MSVKTDQSYTLKNGFADLWDPSILNTLPENKKDGSFLYSEHLIQEYLQWYLTSVCVFGTIFMCFKTYFERIQHKPYMSKNKLERVEYLQLWTANCHHFFIIPIVIYMYTHPECDGSYTGQFIADKTCFYTIDSGCVKSNLVTVGYLSYDFILYKFFMPYSPLNQ